MNEELDFPLSSMGWYLMLVFGWVNSCSTMKFLKLSQSVRGLVVVGWLVFLKTHQAQSELPRPIPWNSIESDLRSTSKIYFDNVTLTLHNATLTSKKPYQHNKQCDCSKTNGKNEVYVVFFQ